MAGWAAREALVADGLATAADVARWDAAFERFYALPGEKVHFVPQFRAVVQGETARALLPTRLRTPMPGRSWDAADAPAPAAP